MATVLLEHALWRDDADTWLFLPRALRRHLDNKERAALAYVALRALDADDAALAVSAALGDDRSPVAPLFNPMDEARGWAEFAHDDETEAYALACFERMAPNRQQAFLGYVQRRAA